MDEQEKIKAFTKGYNDGYLLSKHDPKLMKEIMKNPQQGNPQFEGMLSGQRAQEREQFLKNIEEVRQHQQENSQRPRLR